MSQTLRIASAFVALLVSGSNSSPEKSFSYEEALFNEMSRAVLTAPKALYIEPHLSPDKASVTSKTTCSSVRLCMRDEFIFQISGKAHLELEGCPKKQ